MSVTGWAGTHCFSHITPDIEIAHPRRVLFLPHLVDCNANFPFGDGLNSEEPERLLINDIVAFNDKVGSVKGPPLDLGVEFHTGTIWVDE